MVFLSWVCASCRTRLITCDGVHGVKNSVQPHLMALVPNPVILIYIVAA